MNKNIIIAIIIVVVLGAVGVAALNMNAHTQNGKITTSIQVLSGDTLKNGDQIHFILKDSSGKALANQQVKITYVEDGVPQNYSIITSANGEGFLVLNNEEAGQYNVTITYAGNDQYAGSNITKVITIEEGQSDAETSSETNSTASTVEYNNGTSNNSGDNDYYYNSEYNIVYDSNGKIIGGQNDGMDAFEVISEYKDAEYNSNGHDLE